MKSIFRTLIAITFSLLLVMTPSVAVFADDDSALDNNQPAKTQETNKGSDDQKGGTEKSDNNDDDSSPDNNGIIQKLADDDDNQKLDNDIDSDDNDHEIKPGNDGDDPDFGDDPDLGSDEDGDGEDNGDGTDDDDVDPAVPAPVVKPVTVTITDFGNSFLFEADADGTVRISGLFITYDYGATGSECFVMIVGGRAYPITIHSTGKVTGRLPKGFSIKNDELIIKGVTADMDIWFVDHSMVSGISEEPDEDGSYSEPSKASEKTRRSSSEQKVSGYTVTATAAPASEEATVSATEKTAEVISPANDTAEDEQVLDAFEDPDEAKGRPLPLATGIVLSVGAVSGLGVLLKLKLFAAL